MSNAPEAIPGTTYGRYFLIQIVNHSDLKKNQMVSGVLKGMRKDRSGLDTNFPFDPYNPHQAFGYCSDPDGKWRDSPASSLNTCSWFSRLDSFTTYLMFQLSKPGTIPVPMYSIDWNWSGAVKTNSATGAYDLLNFENPSPNAAALTVTFPTRTNNATNFSWTTLASPFNEN